MLLENLPGYEDRQDVCRYPIPAFKINSTTFQLPVTQGDVSIDAGEPFVLFISFHPSSSSFSLNFNGEALDDYSIVNKVPGISIVSATTSGDVVVNYFGFTSPGKHALSLLL